MQLRRSPKKEGLLTNLSVKDEALTYLSHLNLNGELPLRSRRRLITSLSERLGDDNRARVFVVFLGLLCARRASPVWKSAFITDDTPLGLAESAVSAKIGAGPVSVEPRDLGQLKAHLDDKFLLGEEYFPAVYAGFAAWAVVRDVLKGEFSVNELGESELYIPPEDWDSAFFASLAVAGGATWEEGGNSATRQRFWDWYLRNAVPEAFASATQ